MSNNAPDYENDLVFPPKEEVLSMPRCDIEELKNKIKNIKECLKECHHYIVNTPVYPQGDDVKQAEIHKLLDKIEAVLND